MSEPVEHAEQTPAQSGSIYNGTTESGTSAGQRRPPGHGSFRSGFAFGTLSFLSVAAFSLVSTIVTSRLYGVRLIGEFALVSAPVAAMWVLSTAKEQAALIKEITRLSPRHPRVTQLFAAVFTFSSGLTVVICALAALVSWFVFRGPLHQRALVAPTFASLAGFALVTNTGWNIDSVLSAFVAARRLFWVRLHEVVSFIAIAFAVGLAWHSVWGLVIATIGSSLTALAHRLIAVRPFISARLRLGGISPGTELASRSAALRSEDHAGLDCTGREPTGRHLGSWPDRVRRSSRRLRSSSDNPAAPTAGELTNCGSPLPDARRQACARRP